MKHRRSYTHFLRAGWIILLFGLLIVPALAAVIGRDRHLYRPIGSNADAWTFINLHEGIITVCHFSAGEPPDLRSTRTYPAARDQFLSSKSLIKDLQRRLALDLQSMEASINDMERQGSCDFLDIVHERQNFDRLRMSHSRLDETLSDERQRLSTAIVRALQSRSFAGFRVAYDDIYQQELSVCLPAWLPCVPAFLLLARMGLRRRRARSRLRSGLCIQCGYDLRGGVSSVCSECGAAVPVVSAAPAPDVAAAVNVLKT